MLSDPHSAYWCYVKRLVLHGSHYLMTVASDVYNNLQVYLFIDNIWGDILGCSRKGKERKSCSTDVTFCPITKKDASVRIVNMNYLAGWIQQHVSVDARTSTCGVWLLLLSLPWAAQDDPPPQILLLRGFLLPKSRLWGGFPNVVMGKAAEFMLHGCSISLCPWKCAIGSTPSKIKVCIPQFTFYLFNPSTSGSALWALCQYLDFHNSMKRFYNLPQF